MGYKSFIRAVVADHRRAQRESERRHRLRVRQQVQLQKQLTKVQAQLERELTLQQAKEEVADHEEHVSWLLSAHKTCSDTFDWHAIRSTSPPPVPVRRINQDVVVAEANLRNYKPSLMDKIAGRENAKREELNNIWIRAQQADERYHADVMREHEHKLEEWTTLKNISEEIIASRAVSYITAMKELELFTELEELGQAVQFSVDEDNPSLLESNVYLHESSIIPAETKSLLKSGKVSTKALSTTKLNEVYQDHAVSALLRVAREAFAMLPVLTHVLVHGWYYMLNTQTGHKEWTPVVSVWFPRDTLQSLNFEKLDPSDCLKNFSHVMSFNKNTGFARVEPLQAQSFGIARDKTVHGDLITIEHHED